MYAGGRTTRATVHAEVRSSNGEIRPPSKEMLGPASPHEEMILSALRATMKGSVLCSRFAFFSIAWYDTIENRKGGNREMLLRTELQSYGFESSPPASFSEMHQNELEVILRSRFKGWT